MFENCAGSRLSTVSDGINSAAHSYLVNSPLVDHIVFARNGAPVMTNQNAYDYLNRLTGKSSALAFNYQYNAAGQRSRVTQLMDGSYPEVMGLVVATNTVKVNGQAAYQKWEYFREQVAVSNASAALWTNVTVSAPGQTTVTGNMFVAQNPEIFAYDLDGNLTNDGRWSYTWDGENRLVNMTSLTNAPTNSMYNLAFTYDYMGRRIQEIVSTNSASGYVGQYTNIYVYEGWNLIGVLNP
jgi:YD repeat-containing protein